MCAVRAFVEGLASQVIFPDATEYVVDGWRVRKPGGAGGSGFATRRVFPIWRWRAWPHENAGRPDYFCARGWAWSEGRAVERARSAHIWWPRWVR